jgi:hypothetical protein
MACAAYIRRAGPCTAQHFTPQPLPGAPSQRSRVVTAPPPEASIDISHSSPLERPRAKVEMVLQLVVAAAALCCGLAASVVAQPPAAASPPTSLSGKTLLHRYVSINIGAGQCDPVTKFGTKGDGKSDDTKSIQEAIDACANKGGGTVSIPAPHTYLIYSIAITGSNIELRIEEGATLLASTDQKGWAAANAKGGTAIITAKSVSHIAITGGGTVDGQGLQWWIDMKKPGKHSMFRPHTVDFNHVEHAVLHQTLYTDGPNHILELGCDFCELDGIKVLAPPSTGACEKTNTCSHNTDAVDVHGQPFYIHDVNFTTGDDNVAGHANHTLVEDSYFGSGHGASIGSLCNSFITNFTVRNVSFVGTTAAARIKSHPGCGGHVWDVTYEDLTLHNVATAIQLNQFYFAKPGDPPATMRFERIHFKNITSYGGGAGSAGSGGDTHAVVNLDCDTKYNGKNNCDVTFAHVSFHGLSPHQQKIGMVCKGVRGTTTDLTGLDSCLVAK